jgi:hypothetical protein
MDIQVLLFRRQYLQLFDPDFLTWPPKQLLKLSAIQSWIYMNLFDGEKNSMLPPPRYQLRVLKPLLARIEKSIEDPNQDVGFPARHFSYVPIFFTGTGLFITILIGLIPRRKFQMIL